MSTCQSKIVGIVRSPMLFGNNMLDVMRQFRVLLPEHAILALVVRAPTNESSRYGIHIEEAALLGRLFQISPCF